MSIKWRAFSEADHADFWALAAGKKQIWPFAAQDLFYGG
jgi:hypothetical protein